MARFILWAVLLYVLWRVGRRLLAALLQGMGHPPGGGRTVGLVRDPVCGMFVAPSNALTSGTGANTRYFCSEKCRQEYAARG